MNGLIGTTLGGRYLVERKLGEGGFGAVFAAQHLGTHAKVAIKVLSQELSAGTEMRERFKDEVRILGTLNHPHIVQIHDCGETPEGLPFLAMEFLKGEDLASRLVAGARVPLPWVIQLAEQVGSALIAAHQAGIVHRDIKPHNLFLVQCPAAYSSTILCKVLDFGIAKFRRTVALTVQHSILGTPAYMAPEAIKGDTDAIDFRADQWSLAVVMYQALTGRLPFDGDGLMALLYQVVEEAPPALSALCPELPEHIAVAVMRALSKDKASRFPSIADFIAALQPDRLTALPARPPQPQWLRRGSVGALALSLLAAGNTARVSHRWVKSARLPVPTSYAAAPPAGPPAVSAAAAGIAAAAALPAAISPPPGRATSPKTNRTRVTSPVASKSPKSVSRAVGTSKEDIDALFGPEYRDIAPEHPNRGR